MSKGTRSSEDGRASKPQSINGGPYRSTYYPSLLPSLFLAPLVISRAGSCYLPCIISPGRAVAGEALLYSGVALNDWMTRNTGVAQESVMRSRAAGPISRAGLTLRGPLFYVPGFSGCDRLYRTQERLNKIDNELGHSRQSRVLLAIRPPDHHLCEQLQAAGLITSQVRDRVHISLWKSPWDMIWPAPVH